MAGRQTVAVLGAGGSMGSGMARNLVRAGIGEQGTQRCMALAAEHRIAFIDAPVLGTKQPAHEGKLVVLASGPDELRTRVQPIFDAIRDHQLDLPLVSATARRLDESARQHPELDLSASYLTSARAEHQSA